MKTRAGVFAALILLLSLSTYAQDFTGKVVGVTDGDTITVMHSGRAEKVRLEGIDCPESDQAFGTKAKQATSKYCFGREVTVRVTGADKYGRTLAVIILLDGSSLNQHLLADGLAWHYKKYSSDATLSKLENEARQAKRGVWSDARPTAPWNFRHTGGPSPPTVQDLHTSESANAGANATVYITRTGSKYHSAGCMYLRSSATPTSLKDVAGRYQPCSKCSPPAREEVAEDHPTVSPKASDLGEQQVCVTRTGSKYHRCSCSYLGKSSIPMAQKDAVLRYSPCSRCKPPALKREARAQE